METMNLQSSFLKKVNSVKITSRFSPRSASQNGPTINLAIMTRMLKSVTRVTAYGFTFSRKPAKITDRTVITKLLATFSASARTTSIVAIGRIPGTNRNTTSLIQYKVAKTDSNVSCSILKPIAPPIPSLGLI